MGIVLHGETRHDDASALEMAAREQEAAGVARMREAMGAMGGIRKKWTNRVTPIFSLSPPRCEVMFHGSRKT